MCRSLCEVEMGECRLCEAQGGAQRGQELFVEGTAESELEQEV